MTDYFVDNAYTLRTEHNFDSSGHYSRMLTRVFNFQSRQVTTIYNEWLAGSSNALTSQMHVQNFGEVESQDEIHAMHAKLKEKGGNPPELDTKPPAARARLQP